jgi:hypothetical protein
VDSEILQIKKSIRNILKRCGVNKAWMETCSSDDWILDIGVGEAWAYFRRCRSVEKFVGGYLGEFWDELSGGPKRKTRNTRIPWLLRYVGHEATFLRSRLYNLGCGTVLMELCEDIMETLVCPHAILISDGHGFNDLTRWQCSGMSGSVVACQL